MASLTEGKPATSYDEGEISDADTDELTAAITDDETMRDTIKTQRIVKTVVAEKFPKAKAPERLRKRILRILDDAPVEALQNTA